MSMDLKKLIAVGAHFGHQTSRWNPKMAPYIWGHKNNVHLIDVSKTAHHLERAAQFLQKMASEGKTILWVGTKKAAQEIVRTTATDLGMPYVTHRWIGGTLSNHSQVKKSVTKLMHFEDIVSKAEKFPHYTKKEINTFNKALDRLEKNVGGIKDLSWPLGAVVLVDVSKEKSALKEASTLGIPVVAIVDTNGDPSLVDYVVPSNDDAPRVIKLLVEYLADAVRSGKDKADQVAKEAAVAQELARKQQAAKRQADSEAKAAAEQAVKVAAQAARAKAAPVAQEPVKNAPAKPEAAKKEATSVESAE